MHIHLVVFVVPQVAGVVQLRPPDRGRALADSGSIEADLSMTGLAGIPLDVPRGGR